MLTALVRVGVRALLALRYRVRVTARHGIATATS